jgi:hypothetical protein
MLALGVVTAAFNTKPARAQILEGKFTLSSTTQWGRATLPAGDYSFTLDHVQPGSLITLFRETRGVAFIMAQGVSSTTSGRSEMVLENGTVRKLSLPQIGATFEYPANKPHGRAAPREPELAQILPVSARAAGR